jgi:hypothetical protein
MGIQPPDTGPGRGKATSTQIVVNLNYGPGALSSRDQTSGDARSFSR